ncbi:MAG TPA: hypothetical protein DCG34_04845 [Clostridiales bacterium]|jgi:hypothetical protein|nr:hypothetical protein [Clostridiales bacterium]
MKKQEEVIVIGELEDFLTEIEALVRAETFKADRNANEHRAPQPYRDDMQGYSRGVSIWGLKVIKMIRERFCTEKKA